MIKNKNSENIEIIKEAYSILESGYGFQKCTAFLQCSDLDGVSEEEYKKLDYKLKAIRQDIAKILVIMNSIDKTYSSYQKNEYSNTYYSLVDDQATSELGCFIEYLFAKYRVILEYIQQILEICIPPRFDKKEKKEYDNQKKGYEKYNFLLQYIKNNIEKDSNILNIKWFQQLRMERNFIIHEGATCLVFGDKKNLLFKVMTLDALDKDDKKNQDMFFTNNNGLVYYSYYWGLQISKLIIFIETIFKFLLKNSSMTEEKKWICEKLLVKNEFIDENGVKLPDIQDVLGNLLKLIIEKN